MTTFRHKPYAVVPASTAYKLTIAADNGAPTAQTRSVHNVVFAPTSGINAVENRQGPKKVQISATFTGVGAALADVTAILWGYDEDSDEWYGSNMVPLRGVDAISATGGSIGHVDWNPAYRVGYCEIDGLDADEDAVLVFTKVE
jgi:hypothetical protein